MESLKPLLCGLCSEIINDNNFQKLGVVLDTLEGIFPNYLNLKTEISKDSPVCSKCSEIIKMVQQLRTASIKSEPHEEIKCSQMNSQKRCKFCHIFGEEVNTIDEIMRGRIYSVLKLCERFEIICQDCLGNLEKCETFVQTCLKTEEQLSGYASFGQNDYLDMNIKTEEIVIKTEEDKECQEDEISSSGLFRCAHCAYQTIRKKNFDGHLKHHKSSGKIYRCANCSYATIYKSSLRSHIMIHRDPSRLPLYQCESCSYSSKRRSDLNQHTLKHKNPLEVHIHKCEFCNYESRRKNDVKKHKIMHLDKSQIRTFNCNLCSYRAKRRQDLSIHLLRHKSSDEVQMFKCEYVSCRFESKRKSTLQLHILVHQKPFEVTMYQCEKCLFRTKYKRSLRIHNKKIHFQHQ